ncbi:MAG: hypothetical protein JWO53_1129 [Chlamydiia bacterium]|nr:hypothetical protein [Chlamydiia bacterium]
MSTSNTSLPSNIQPSFEVASLTPTSFTGQGQSTGLGVLVLPHGERVMIAPSTQVRDPISIPAIQPVQLDRILSMNVRVMPAVNELPKDGLSFDTAMIEGIRVLRTEWSDQHSSPDDEDDQQGHKRQRKMKKKVAKVMKSLSTKAKAPAKELSKRKVKRGTNANSKMRFDRSK